MSEKTEKAVEAKSARDARTTTYSIKGGQSVIWGVDETLSYGTITDVSTDDSAQTEQILNQYGAVVGMVVYDNETSVKVTIVATSAATKPATGTIIAINSVNFVVTAISDKASNKALRKWELTLMRWTNMTISAS